MYLACLNVSVGEDMEARLTEDYLTCRGLNPTRTEMRLYRDLYLSDDPAASDHEYAYASRMKLLATINSKQLDLVLMNREAYDLCSASGYLLDLTNLVDSAYLTANQVILEDNAVEYNLNEAQEYIAVTQTQSNAVELTQLSAFQEAGFSGKFFRAAQAAVAADDNECINIVLFEIFVSQLTAFRCVPAFAEACSEECAAALNGISYRYGSHFLHIIINKTAVTVENAPNAGTIADYSTNNGSDGGVHARCVCAAC